jgi:hypothetical protein
LVCDGTVLKINFGNWLSNRSENLQSFEKVRVPRVREEANVVCLLMQFSCRANEINSVPFDFLLIFANITGFKVSAIRDMGHGREVGSFPGNKYIKQSMCINM